MRRALAILALLPFFLNLLAPAILPAQAMCGAAPVTPDRDDPPPATADNAGDPKASIPAKEPGIGKVPHIEIDAKNKTIRVECKVCNTENYGLEFFCCHTNTNEYESVLSSEVMASHLHAALLLLGLKPGEPVKYSESAKKWLPPHGPPLQISCQFEKNGKPFVVPAYRLMRNVKTRKEVPPMTWVFTGSKVMEDGNYAADVTGYLLSVLNNELTVIDIPSLASRALESREWEPNTDLLPARGSAIWLIIEPAGKEVTPRFEANPSTAAAATMPATLGAAEPLDDVRLDAEKVKKLKTYWTKAVAPHDAALRQAAQAHYEVIESLRREQQRLIDEADRVQRVIDDLQKQYQDMTTPNPKE